MHDDMTISELTEIIKNGPNGSEEETIEFNQYPIKKTNNDMKIFNIFMKVSKLFWNIKVHGLENINNDEKYIICPNHESYFDGMWVVGCLNNEFRRDICSLAASHLFENKLFNRGCVILGGIPVYRNGNTAPSMKRAYECLISGQHHMLIHPEGTRTRTGKMGAFKLGASKLAIDTKIKIIPVCINGAYDIFPPNARFPHLFDWKHMRRYTLEIYFGTPINPTEKNAKEISLEIAKQINFFKKNKETAL
jgi:1-acyl-sn-glycerol-3-phosphate acyltransferase